MATTATSSELIYEAAGDIGAVLPGEALSAEDYEAFDRRLDWMLDDIANVLYIGDKDAIPNIYCMTLSRMLGNLAGAKVVGTPLNREAWNMDKIHLRELAARDPTGETLKAVYY